MIDIGESLVGSWLRYVAGCDVVVYGTRLPNQGEIDVLALKLETRDVFVCEVATHLDGLLYRDGNGGTAAKVAKKVESGVKFAEKSFPEHRRHYMLWSPKVGPTLTSLLDDVVSTFSTPSGDGATLEIVANDRYRERLQDLVDGARQTTSHTSEEAFRMLQILTHVKGLHL